MFKRNFGFKLLLFLTLTMLTSPVIAFSFDDDIVWQHRNGQVHYWPMQNGQRQGGIHVHSPVGGDWTLAGVGDVD